MALSKENEMVMVSAAKDKDEGVTDIVVSLRDADLRGSKFDLSALLVAILPSLIQALIDYLSAEQGSDEAKKS